MGSTADLMYCAVGANKDSSAILVTTTYHIFGINSNHYTVARLAMMTTMKMLLMTMTKMQSMTMIMTLMTTYHFLPIPSDCDGAVARVTRPCQEPQRLPSPEFNRKFKLLSFSFLGFISNPALRIRMDMR